MICFGWWGCWLVVSVFVRVVCWMGFRYYVVCLVFVVEVGV